MKYAFTIILLLSIFNINYAQVDSNIIDINNIKTMVNADGLLFGDGNEAFYRFPKDSLTSTIFAGNLWLGAYDENNNLHIAASTNNKRGNDFQSGFIGSDAGELNKVWRISKTEIKALRRDFDNNNEINSSIPLDILMYPAYGNPNVVGTLTGNPVDITVDYLPYEDRNNDGLYNVYDGDLPIINGDEQLTWIINDSLLHTETYGIPLEFDIVGMMYANKCNSDELIDNTIFIKYDLINRSIHTLDSFKFGMWIDSDLGCHLDDYIGCSIPTNSFYFYNENEIDGQGGCQGRPSYGENVPIQSVTYLNQSLDAFVYYTPYVSTGEPQIASEYYLYLNGVWRDGLPFTYGGSAYGGNTPPYPYVYFENPADSGSNSMAQQSVTGSYLWTIGVTTLPQFQPNEKHTVKFTYITHENIPQPKPDITLVENRITQMQSLYDNDKMNWDVYLSANPILEIGQSVTITPTIDNQNSTYSYIWSNSEITESIKVNTPNTYSVTVTNNETGCTKTDQIEVQFSEEELEQLTDFEKIIVYPNPTNNVIYINFIASELPILNIQIYDMTGKYLKSISLENSNIQTIDVSDLNTGMYIFEFQNEVGETFGHRKIMILD